MFDLDEDPYEKNNLYFSENQDHVSAKEQLYALLPGYLDRAKTKISIHWSNRAKRHWQEHDNNMLPWVNEDTMANDGDYPSYGGTKGCTF